MSTYTNSNTPFPTLADKLKKLVNQYNKIDFILNDPIRIPRHYREKCDIEISAFVTAWLCWGTRKQIVAKAEWIDFNIFQRKPYDYIQSRRWETMKTDFHCLYRTYKFCDFALLCECLYRVYETFKDLESAVLVRYQNGDSLTCTLAALFPNVKGIPRSSSKSACKRLWMLLRWLIRQDGIVDIGIWKSISPSELLIPLDTHVFHVARELGITCRKCADKQTANEITEYFRKIYPEDPAIGDFALFGLGLEEKTLLKPL